MIFYHFSLGVGLQCCCVVSGKQNCFLGTSSRISPSWSQETLYSRCREKEYCFDVLCEGAASTGHRRMPGGPSAPASLALAAPSHLTHMVPSSLPNQALVSS